MVPFEIPFVTKATVAPDYSQRIPFTIMMTFKSRQLSEVQYKQVQNIIKMNPEYDMYFYGDEECKEFLKDQPDALDAFNKIKPGAFKADLFRVAFLERMGGIYIDLDLLPLKPFRDILRPLDDFVCPLDVLMCGKAKYTPIYQAFLATIPQHPYMIKGKQLIVQNILSQSYGENMLDISGPYCLGRAMQCEKTKPGIYGAEHYLQNSYSQGVLDENGEQLLKVEGGMWAIMPSYLRSYINQRVYGERTYDIVFVIILVLWIIVIFLYLRGHVLLIALSIVSIAMILFYV